MAYRAERQKLYDAPYVITSSGQQGVIIGGAGARDMLVRLTNGQVIAHSADTLRIEEPPLLEKGDLPDEERENEDDPK